MGGQSRQRDRQGRGVVTPAELVAATRAAQGLPAQVEDPAALDAIARIIAGAVLEGGEPDAT